MALYTSAGELGRTAGTTMGQAVGMAVGPAIAAAGAPKGVGKKTANQIVQSLENPFGQKLAQIELMARTNPQQAQLALQDAWEQYVTDVARFANPTDMSGRLNADNLRLVAGQSLSNPKLIDTVNTLWSQTGGQGSLTDSIPRFMSQHWASYPEQKPGNLPLRLSPIDLITQAGKMITGGLLNRGSGGGGGSNPLNEQIPVQKPDPNSPIPKTSNTGGILTKAGEILTNGGSGGGGGGKSLLEQLLGYVIPGIGAGVDLYGMISGSKAAKEAAEIEAQSAKEAREQLERFYNQSRQDQLPNLQTGQISMATLSNLMGLPAAPENQFNAQVPFQQNQPINPELRAVPVYGRSMGSVMGGR